MLKSTHEDQLEPTFEANEEDVGIRMSSKNRDEQTGYLSNAAKPETQQIFDLLREIRTSQVDHNENAATKADMNALVEQNAELLNCVERLRHHVDLFSVHTLTTVLSLTFLAFSTVLLLVTLFQGPITISFPLPHLLVVLSIGMYLMARKLPRRSL